MKIDLNLCITVKLFQHNFRGGEDSCKLGKEYLNAPLFMRFFSTTFCNFFLHIMRPSITIRR